MSREGFIYKKDRQGMVALYCLMGEALCMIQHLEDALSHSLALKQSAKYPNNMLRDESNKALEKYRRYTLGQAVSLAKKHGLYHDKLQDVINDLLIERNWLIHKCIDDLYNSARKEGLFHRIKNISSNAVIIKHDIEVDLVAFSELRGMDMSRVRAAIKQYYDDN